MKHLGDFGKPIEKKLDPKAEFDTVGIGTPTVPVRLMPADQVPMAVMMEFARLTAINVPGKSIAAQSVLYGVISGSVHTDDWELARIALSTMDDVSMINLCFALYERWAEAPLGGMPESSAGSSQSQPKPSKSSGKPSRRAQARKRYAPPEEKEADMVAALGLNGSSSESPQT